MTIKHLPGKHNQKKHAGFRQQVDDITYLNGRVSTMFSSQDTTFVAEMFDLCHAGTARSYVESIEANTGFKLNHIGGGFAFVFVDDYGTSLTTSLARDDDAEGNAARGPTSATVSFYNKDGYESDESKYSLSKTLDLLVKEFTDRGVDGIETNTHHMPIPLLVEHDFVANRGGGKDSLDDGWSPLVWKQLMILQGLDYIDRQYGLSPKERIPDIHEPHVNVLARAQQLPARYTDLANQLPDDIPAQDFFDTRHPDYLDIPLFTESLTENASIRQHFYKDLKASVTKHLPGRHSQKRHAGTHAPNSDAAYLESRLADPSYIDAIVWQFNNVRAGSVQSYIKGVENNTGFKFDPAIQDYDHSVQFSAPDGTVLNTRFSRDFNFPDDGGRNQVAIMFQNPNGYDSEETKNNLVATMDFLIKEFTDRGIATLDTFSNSMPLPLIIEYNFIAELEDDEWESMKDYRKFKVLEALIFLDKKYKLPTKKRIPIDITFPDVYDSMHRLPARYAKIAEKMTTAMPIQDYLDIRHPDYPEISLFTELLISDDADDQYFYKELK